MMTSRKRTQFSSCDACRRARVSCDASEVGRRTGTGPCSRCEDRKRSCTFEWVKSRRKAPSSSHGPFRSFVVWRPGEDDNAKDAFQDPTDQSPEKLAHWADRIFEQCFESVFGGWLGRSGCPLVNSSNAGEIVAPTRVCRTLDVIADGQLDQESTLYLNSQIDASLRLAARSYAARWVPGTDKTSLETFALSQWRAARRDMLRVINRPSYRSALTLYLFGQTPVPVGLGPDEETDGINGAVCIQTALKMIQQLRGRLHSLQFDASATKTSSLPPLSRDIAPLALDLENRMYWAAAIWDTSASLAQNVRSSLITGLKGGCSEPTWVVTRSFLVGSLKAQAEHWRRGQMSEDTASQALAAAGVARLYVWRTIASLKEGLVEGEAEDAMRFAWEAHCDARDIYKTDMAPVLKNCQRRLASLSQDIKLRWYEEMLQYNVGILILVDAVEAAQRSDFLSQLEHVRIEAEEQLTKVIERGLDDVFVVDDERWSMLAVAPYPHYCLAALQLLTKTGGCDTELVRRALDELPRASKSVSVARTSLLHR